MGQLGIGQEGLGVEFPFSIVERQPSEQLQTTYSLMKAFSALAITQAREQETHEGTEPLRAEIRLACYVMCYTVTLAPRRSRFLQRLRQNDMCFQ